MKTPAQRLEEAAIGLSPLERHGIEAAVISTLALVFCLLILFVGEGPTKAVGFSRYWPLLGSLAALSASIACVCLGGRRSQPKERT